MSQLSFKNSKNSRPEILSFFIFFADAIYGQHRPSLCLMAVDVTVCFH